ncbi:MAG: helix-turn-helix transcriptional regulator [Actinomycetota bacterium]|nr:helix-turn-helix transcriptional regulator [Actinomycetota bacterium]
MLGFTQEGLAEQLGVDTTTVRRWESGETEGGPQPGLRPKLARCLQVSVEELNELLDSTVTPTISLGKHGYPTRYNCRPATITKP